MTAKRVSPMCHMCIFLSILLSCQRASCYIDQEAQAIFALLNVSLMFEVQLDFIVKRVINLD